MVIYCLSAKYSLKGLVTHCSACTMCYFCCSHCQVFFWLTKPCNHNSTLYQISQGLILELIQELNLGGSSLKNAVGRSSESCKPSQWVWGKAPWNYIIWNYTCFTDLPVIRVLLNSAKYLAYTDSMENRLNYISKKHDNHGWVQSAYNILKAVLR